MAPSTKHTTTYTPFAPFNVEVRTVVETIVPGDSLLGPIEAAFSAIGRWYQEHEDDNNRLVVVEFTVYGTRFTARRLSSTRLSNTDWSQGEIGQ